MPRLRRMEKPWRSNILIKQSVHVIPDYDRSHRLPPRSIAAQPSRDFHASRGDIQAFCPQNSTTVCQAAIATKTIPTEISP